MSAEPAFEIVGDLADAGPFVFTCEHASNRVPSHLELSASDERLLKTHWGWDIGARDVVLELVRLLGGQAVLSDYSRLVIDPNREPNHPTSIRLECEGEYVDFNRDLSAEEVQRRHRELFHPFHDAADELVSSRAKLDAPFHLLSVHSFTPQYLGKTRPMEIGVLFSEFDHLAFDLEQALTREAFETALNAPYSGKGEDGLIYSIYRHAKLVGVPFLELEIRQDLIDTRETAREVAGRIARALDAFRPGAAAADS